MFPVPSDKTSCFTNIHSPSEDVPIDVDEEISNASEEAQLL